MDTVVKQLCDCFEPARSVVRLTKLWAATHELTSHHEGYLNGVGWALLVIFYLQKELLIPPVAALRHGTKAPRASARSPVSALLRGLFEFLAGRGDPSTMR